MRRRLAVLDVVPGLVQALDAGAEAQPEAAAGAPGHAAITTSTPSEPSNKITISGGGYGTGAHSLNEVFDPRDSLKGTQRAILLALSLAR